MIPHVDGPEYEGPRTLALPGLFTAMGSPPLSTAAGLEIPAYELKFLVTEAQARDIEEMVHGRLVTDPHADPALGNAYETTSVYFDTARFDVFHRVGSCRRRKHQLRRYNQAAEFFLERKVKWGDRVKKRRTMVRADDLSLLAREIPVASWPGHWFQRHLARRQLAPVCRIAYQRVALVGRSEQGPMRLTFDRRVRGIFARDWSLDFREEGLPLLADEVICEFKYRAFVPSLFKEIIQALRLTPRPVSKYRTFIRTYGQALDGRAVDA